MLATKTLIRRCVWGAVFIAVCLLAAWRLENLATILILSFLLAYVLNPLVNRLDRIRYINRSMGTAIVLLGMLISVSAILLVIVPEVIGEFRLFMAKMPTQLNRLRDWLVPIVEDRFGYTVPLSVEDAIIQFEEEINGLAPKILSSATDILVVVFGSASSVVSSGVAVLMFPLFLFFLLRDYPHIVTTVDDLIPPLSKPGIHELGSEVDKSLSAFLHGQFIVMLILGTLYSVGYSVVGIPVAIGIGLITGVLCFIPYVGAATGFVLALLLSLLEFKGPGPVMGVVIVFGTVQLLDAVLITPNVIGGQLGLKPLWIIIALMAGGELFGFMGVLLAVPTIAVLKVLVAHVVVRYKESILYRDSGEFGKFQQPGQKQTNEE